MSLTRGSQLGAYEILTPLGAGGMGEVYRARDPKLGRDVAIKILPEPVLADPDRVARFQREAQLLASLNHPNIAAIYGLEDAGPARFIVMELVEGESLDARLKARAPSSATGALPSASGARGFSRGAGLPIVESLAIARQIVDALEAAHDKGIIHRDLKPANIMLTLDQQVKVLDFGLAKLEPTGTAEASGPAANLTHSPTLTFAATQMGMILGTAAYMSPEQARGRVADKRTDVWAFGCVLYEMLAGKRAFEGEDATDVIAAVVRGEPDWSALPSTLSPAIRSLVMRCLAKDRKARIPDMSVVRFLLDDAGTAPAHAVIDTPTVSRRRMGMVAALAAVVAATIAAIGMRALVRPVAMPPAKPARFTIAMPATQPVGLGGPDRVIAISPDGARIVSISGGTLGGGGQLMVRALDQLDAVPIRGLANVRAPFISPDSRWIGFFDAGELKKVSMGGGPPITICRVVGGTRGSTWADDNTIVFATNDATTGLMSVPAAGGEPKLLTKPDTEHGEVDHFFPTMLPDGRTVLFTVIRTGSADNAEIVALDLQTGQRKTVIRGGTHAEYVRVTTSKGSAGYIAYASAGGLRAIRFDAVHLAAVGDPVVMLDQIRVESTGAAEFAVSRDGSLVYGVGGTAGFENRSLVWVNRRGQEQPIDAPVRQYTSVRISPDGTRVALAVSGAEQDIWVLDLRHSTLSRLTFGPSIEQNPVWMPDGKWILFSSSLAGIPNVFRQLSDNTGSMEQLTKSAGLTIPFSVSPDGKNLVVSTAGGTGLGIVQLDQPNAIKPLNLGPGTKTNAEVSPDGRWLAYQSNETGQFQIYVRPFPNVDAGRWQITTDQTGGIRPVWGRNGRELLYVAGREGDRTLMAVPIHTTAVFEYGKPTRLFSGRYSMALPVRAFDVSLDGQTFLMIKDAQTVDPAAETANAFIVLNWFEELKTRLPPTP